MPSGSAALDISSYWSVVTSTCILVRSYSGTLIVSMGSRLAGGQVQSPPRSMLCLAEDSAEPILLLQHNAAIMILGLIVRSDAEIE
jgi:hypothetical protein